METPCSSKRELPRSPCFTRFDRSDLDTITMEALQEAVESSACLVTILDPSPGFLEGSLFGEE